MSSATSTNPPGVRLKVDPDAGSVRLQADRSDEGFRAWHFFVLASLMLATAAVFMSRQSTPEHLILISFTIGAAGAASAGFYRMLAPLTSEAEHSLREPLSARSRDALEREKTLVLRSIKELEFDRAMRKVSDRDFEEMGGRLRARALSLMKQLDTDSSGYRALIEKELKARLAAAGSARLQSVPRGKGDTQGGHSSLSVPGVFGDGDTQGGHSTLSVPGVFCAACGVQADVDARFCKACGTRLQQEPRA